MAQHPFAAQAREAMEASGIVFNADGTTSVREVEEKVEKPEDKVADTGVEKTTVEQTVEDPAKTDERDSILAMQREELEQLRKEKEAWQSQQTSQTVTKSEREVELEKELAEIKAQMATQTESQQADAFRQMLEQQGFDSENLDDDVLLEIRDRFVRPMADKVSKLESKLAQYDQKFRDPTPEEKLEQVKQATNQKIFKEIPDFQTIFNSKAFQDKLGQKDSRFPTATYGQTLQIAYENGNHEFIVQEVRNFLNGGTAQTISDIADVGATNGVGKTVDKPVSDSQYTFTDEEAIQMLRKRQMGDLSMQEYSEYRAKLDEHRSRT